MALAAMKVATVGGAKISITHPRTGLATGIVISVLGSDSEAYRNLLRKQQNRRLEAAAKNRGMRKGSTVTAEALEEESLDLLIACTVGWETVEKDAKGADVSRPEIEMDEGEWLPCTPENARRVYADPGLAWLREQVDAEIADRSNFLKS